MECVLHWAKKLSYLLCETAIILYIVFEGSDDTKESRMYLVGLLLTVYSLHFGVPFYEFEIQLMFILLQLPYILEY